MHFTFWVISLVSRTSQQPQWPRQPLIKFFLELDVFINPSTKMTYSGLSMWNGSSKIHYFMDFWPSFCWRLWRPWMLLSTKSKGHKSKFRISWMYKYHFYELKVHFWWLNKRFFWCRSSLNTLYIREGKSLLSKCIYHAPEYFPAAKLSRDACMDFCRAYPLEKTDY